MSIADPLLPPSVAPTWRARTAEWERRGGSDRAGVPDRPLFMGGCPRSGTTLLQVMLDMHPELGMPRETNFIRELWWRRRHFGDLRDPANRRRVAEWIFSDKEHLFRRLIHRRLTREEAIEEVAAAPPTIGSIIERCIRLHAHDTPRFGDKRPAYSGFIGPLLQMFPDAQYVNVVRDPRGVAASQAAMGWDQPDIVVPAAIVRWEFAVARTDHYARELHPDQLLDVRYEDLVADPHAQLTRVLEFAGLTAGDVVDRLVSGERDGWFVGPHVLAGAPVTTASVERWRTRLTPSQIALVEQATAPLMERFGYRPDSDAEPTRHEHAMLAHRRRAFRRRWRRTRRDDLLRELLHRRPVVAAGHE
ncbi:MAG TPA: sulfotransferase, partial [Solirubrobacteraceae bacterium]|nr:sulfotransferase [Solirubrobacteraceae bacterium]